MSDDRAEQVGKFLAGLTVSRVALGIALAAGGVFVYVQIADSTQYSPTWLGAVGGVALGVSIGAAVWAKMEQLQAKTVALLENRIMGLEADVGDVRRQLEACLERDRAMVQRLNVIDEHMRNSDFGGLG